MSFFKIWLCLIGIHLPIRTKPAQIHSLYRAKCACGYKHWRWFER